MVLPSFRTCLIINNTFDNRRGVTHEGPTEMMIATAFESGTKVQGGGSLGDGEGELGGGGNRGKFKEYSKGRFARLRRGYLPREYFVDASER